VGETNCALFDYSELSCIQFLRQRIVRKDIVRDCGCGSTDEWGFFLKKLQVILRIAHCLVGVKRPEAQWDNPMTSAMSKCVDWTMMEQGEREA
jgi:hypothetical protein